MENEAAKPVVRRRDLRRAEQARKSTRAFSVRTFSTRTFASLSPLKKQSESASTVTAVRGSNGAALRALRRRRSITFSAVGTLAVTGAALTATLLSGVNASSTGEVTTESQATTSALSSEFIGDVANGDNDVISGQSGNVGGVEATSNGDAAASGLSVKRTVLPGCTGEVPDTEASNGQLPDEWLCQVGIGDHRLRQDAAIAFAKMNAAYKSETGEDMKLTDTYRTLDEQVSIAGRKPGLAAKPGTSMHGWGLAIDFGGGAAQASGQQYEWLVAHAGEFGWENPDWAKSSKYEPWHWEYVPGRQGIKDNQAQ